MQLFQQQHPVVVARDWNLLLGAFIFTALIQKLLLFCCFYYMYWPIKCLAILLYSRTVYFLPHVLLLMIKLLARESIRLVWPYGSKARYQYAFGHRIGHTQAVWVDDSIRIDLVLHETLPYVYRLDQ